MTGGGSMIRPLFIHCRPDAGYDLRFDTLMMANMSVAALNRVALNVLGYPGAAIDETYMASAVPSQGERQYLLNLVSNLIESYLSQGDEPVVLCTIVQYNALGTHSFLKELKQRFGGYIRVGVGGQHVTLCPEAREAWLRKEWIDIVASGDAEVLLAQALLGKARNPEGRKRIIPRDHYAPPLYEGYVGLEDRLDEMSALSLRGITDMRMLLTESIRGCSWAHYQKKACEICALDVLAQLQFRELESHFAIERELRERYAVNWIFDVANQWLPVQGDNAQVGWLENYLRAKAQYDAPDINRYCYLNSSSISHRTAPLLRQAGVRMAYVGIDGWDKQSRRAQYTSQRDPLSILEAAQAAGLFIRTSLVVGSGLTRENVAALPRFVKSALDQFGDTILSFGVFEEIVLPGAENWQTFSQKCDKGGMRLRQGQIIFERFKRDGYLSLEDQETLNHLRIRHTQKVPFDDILSAKSEALAIIEGSATLAVDIRRCDQL